MTAAEFSRLERADQIGTTPRSVSIAANAGERAALARRFDLPGIERLEATFALRRDGGAILADGRVTAAVVQACVATGEPVPAAIDEPVALRFVADADPAGEDEVELTDDLIDTISYDGTAIDLGEAAAETMALALDPFPRAPDAAAVLRERGVIAEDEVVAEPVASPFDALAALRDRLGGDQSS